MYEIGIKQIFSLEHAGHMPSAITLFFAFGLNTVAFHEHFLQSANWHSKLSFNAEPSMKEESIEFILISTRSQIVYIIFEVHFSKWEILP